MHNGIDRLIAGTPAPLVARLKSARLGYLTNDLAITADARRARDAIVASGFPVERFFGPEHGLSGRASEGAVVTSGRDPATGIPVVSLYGDRVRPTPADLDGLDIVLVDLPDVGSRFYTYIWTLSHLLEACAEANVAVVIADRPNPLGGSLAQSEGPMLDEDCHSLVGRWSMPIRHSLTIGEAARHWVRARGIAVDLEVVSVEGWDRAEPTWAMDRPWMPPSLNMPSAATALLYPGTCLAEGVNLAEGRSTAVPFRVIGAPWLDGAALADRMAQLDLAGVSALEYGFTPWVRDWAGEACTGIILHVTDAQAFRPVHTGVRLLAAVEEIHPGMLSERTHLSLPGESTATPLEKLFGHRGAFDEITAGAWNDRAAFEVPHWADAVRQDLLYG
ncbi:DUF1343 domain-containing protein [Cryobacterium sp. PH31-L1]|uniref:exo-beta-N-acetylmuramidase NamZ family protein n=1 Tax=Cryobacterium sp. PH31-L1 TaxID=3046199 RepID=UPI0024BAFAF0|nr:DUF1343 domain-containing protein [Cryobacterium sp. PH31-L1]MDJ0376982.1 DUF1343 domain-containing protein [Cryobacterium sp. PH31-L1]